MAYRPPAEASASLERLDLPLVAQAGLSVSADGEELQLGCLASAASAQTRRKSRKSELDELREHVKELEGKLAALQTRRSECEDGAAVPKAPSALAASSPAALWERTARAQKDQRILAEVENARLREVLEGQIKVALSLEKLLRKRPSHEALGPRRFGAKRLAAYDPGQDEAVFDALGARLDELYQQLDAAWLETGLVVNQHEVDEAGAKLDAFNNIYLEIISSKVMPFSARRVSDAAWSLMGDGVKVTNGHISAIMRTDDVIRSRFSLTLRLRRSEAQIRVNMSVKRFEEDSGRVVFAWACEGHMEGSRVGAERVKISENGWAVVEKHRMTSPALGLGEYDYDGSCILQMCMRMVPEFPEPTQQKEHVGLLSEMIIGSYTTNIGCLVQCIENMLLSEAQR